MITIKQYSQGLTGPELVNYPELEMAVNKQIAIKNQIKSLESELQTTHDKISEFFWTKGLSKFVMPNGEKVSAYLSSRTSTNIEKFCINLLSAGVSAEIIEQCKDAATIKTTNKKLTINIK